MEYAYIDTSLLVGIVFGEPGADALAARVHRFERLYSAALLEAEFLAAAEREGVRERVTSALAPIRFVHPRRRLTHELDVVLVNGYLRGADLLHVATALYLFPQPQDAWFLSLDVQQSLLSQKLGFRVFADLER